MHSTSLNRDLKIIFDNSIRTREIKMKKWKELKHFRVSRSCFTFKTFALNRFARVLELRQSRYHKRQNFSRNEVVLLFYWLYFFDVILESGVIHSQKSILTALRSPLCTNLCLKLNLMLLEESWETKMPIMELNTLNR